MVSFLKKFRELIKIAFKNILPVFVFRESGSIAGKPLTVIYAGYSKVKKIYFTKYIFAEKPFKSKFLGLYWFSVIQKNSYINRYKPDVLMIETNPKTIQYFLEQVGYVIPEWIIAVVKLDESINIMKKKPGSDFLSVERLIRKYGLSYTVSQSQEDFDHFFFKMHLPYIQQRYSKGALSSYNYKEYKSLSKSAFLILIHQGNEMCAGGGFVVIKSDTVKFKILGIKDGAFEYVRKGVIGALYYFLVIECQKRGFKSLDIGGTHPFLNDGLTKFKHHMNGEFVFEYCANIDHLSILFNHDSEYVQAFLKQNPFFYVDKDYHIKISAEDRTDD